MKDPDHCSSDRICCYQIPRHKIPCCVRVELTCMHLSFYFALVVNLILFLQRDLIQNPCHSSSRSWGFSLSRTAFKDWRHNNVPHLRAHQNWQSVNVRSQCKFWRLSRAYGSQYPCLSNRILIWDAKFFQLAPAEQPLLSHWLGKIKEGSRRIAIKCTPLMCLPWLT